MIVDHEGYGLSTDLFEVDRCLLRISDSVANNVHCDKTLATSSSNMLPAHSSMYVTRCRARRFVAILAISNFLLCSGGYRILG